MKPITKEKWLEAVKTEARNLRKFALPEELANLDFERFDPEVYNKCIYGQATGDCRNERAIELIKKCCTKYSVNENDEIANAYPKTFVTTRAKINGKNVEFNDRYKYYSSIEHYIQLDEAKNENLISYLKGETENLDL